MASVVGEASSSSPPSASIPPPARSYTHHVFLSFSGKDTRNGITGHLHAALERKGIKTYIDDRDLETGEVISSELLKAIEESVFAITVFSPNYASSSWCLDELQHIVECRKNLGLEVVPLFYGVEPWHVRHQKGSFEEAFQKHEKRFGQNNDKVKRWRDALEHVANLSGFDFKDKHEATLVESIADHILEKLIPKLPSSTENLVGIASRVAEVMRHISIGLNDVRFIGIWGMGGIGKTTIATAVYEAIRGEFKVSCFLANVREARVRNKIVDKQKQLLAKANISANASDNEHDVQTKMQTFLRNKKVLLVLDDVSDEIELKKLAGKKDWFGPGSRIIITTRDIQFLKIYEAHGTCEVRKLDDSDSADLFCVKAFKQNKPDEKYLDLTKEVVKYSGGLPLALEVLGSQLFGRSVDVWHDAIKKIKSNPLAEIHDILKISYDSLDIMEKNIFLDIACFFRGMETDYVTDVLNKCGYYAKSCIQILIDRSLVKKDKKSNMFREESNVLEMHDLLQDLGRSIVIQESPNNPGKRSRLWSSEDIDLVLEKNKGSKDIQVQGIALSGGHWSAEAFSNMTQLKLLIVDDFAGSLHGLSSLPTSLKVLHWRGYPLKTLPLTDQQYELVEITLQEGYIENLWHGKQFLGKLKYLNLSWCEKLKQTPDLSEVPMLQRLVFNNCDRLTEVHPSVVHHKSLTLLDLTGCMKLKALPGKLEMSSLKELILDHCLYFENLPEFGECMKSLLRLSLNHTNIKKLPTSLGCLVGLEDLSIANCPELKCLPDITGYYGNLPRLRILNLSRCRFLTEESFPPNFFRFPSLMDLDLNSTKFVSKPISIHELPKLKCLNLSRCRFPTEESFPPNFFHSPSLMDLDLSCTDFVSIPISIHELPKLKCLKLNCCSKLRCLTALPSSIRELEARLCYSLENSEVNILSYVHGFFVSSSPDPDQVLLEMVIYGSEIPSWFVHPQDGNSISIPCDYPPNERLGIALCYQLRFADPGQYRVRKLKYALVIRNGNNKFSIKKKPMYISCKDDHLYVICLTNDYFSDRFHQGTCFELSILEKREYIKISMTSAAYWVSIEDIKDLKKSEIERPQKKKKKHKKMFGLNKRIEEMEQ